MVAPVSSSRAQHDGFAMLVVILLVVAACLAGYWYAQQSVERSPESWSPSNTIRYP